jgi:flagellar protein FlaJ
MRESQKEDQEKEAVEEQAMQEERGEQAQHELDEKMKEADRLDDIIVNRFDTGRGLGMAHGIGKSDKFSLTTTSADDFDTDISPFKSKDEVSFRILGRYMSIKKRMLFLMGLNTMLVATIIGVNYWLFKEAGQIFFTINTIALFIFMFPIVMLRYSTYKNRKEIEELFPVFLRDFVESTRGGMTIPVALKSVSRNDYKALTPHVKKMAVQLDWGVPVERVLVLFSNKVDSKIISRIVSSVRESHRFGGNLADTLEALSNTAVEVERLREERRLYLHSQMITGYIIFFVFLAVIIALQMFLVPALSSTPTSMLGGEAIATGGVSEASAEEFQNIFRNLIIVQGFFAGLAVGKMAEGAIAAGLKHSMFMMFIGSLVFALAI